MTKRQRGRKAPFDGGDGLGASRRDAIRDARLCAQVAEAVALALGDDAVLCELAVMEVVPTPDASRLAVRVIAPAGSDLDALRDRLDAQGGRLRGEVAAAIHRKRAPTLFFDVVIRTATE